MSSIKDFYRGEDVFITGASGFIGKVLVEKILRTCSEVKTVYLLMRAKRGQTPEDRIKVLTDNPYFSKLKAEQPDAIRKLRVVEGDAKELRLGMSDSDFKKVKSCSMIFHLAASVRFDDPLKDAILLNTRGAREVCELAKNMPNLKVLMHVSTAYVQPLNFHVVEELIDVNCDWRDYIKMAENLPTEFLDAMTMKLTENSPNTYTFTKLLAEHICNDYRDKYNLPVVIYRPAIVAWSDYEVQAGWSESLNGMNGISASGLYGLKRVNVGDPKMAIIPVDLCVKGMIIASEKHKKDSEWLGDIPVYNAAAVCESNLSSMCLVLDYVEDYYLENALGVPGIVFVENKWLGAVLFFLFQIVPAVLVDALLLLFNRKPIVMKLQRILKYSEKSVSHFVNNEFEFDTGRYQDLGRHLHRDDEEDFYLLPRNSLMQYFIKSFIATRENIINENDENAAIAKKRTPYWKALGWAIKVLILYVCSKILFLFYEAARKYCIQM